MAASFSAHRIDDRRRSSVIVHWRRVNNTVGNGLVEAADVSLSFFLFFFMIIFLKRNDQETTVEFTKNHVFSITPPSFDGILMTRSRISSPPPGIARGSGASTRRVHWLVMTSLPNNDQSDVEKKGSSIHDGCRPFRRKRRGKSTNLPRPAPLPRPLPPLLPPSACLRRRD